MEPARTIDEDVATLVGTLQQYCGLQRARAMNTDAQLLTRFRCGDQRAAFEIHNRYVGTLLSFARKRISTGLRVRSSEEDIVQSAFRTFFRHAECGEYNVDPSGTLLSLLRTLTSTKVQKHAERNTADKRDVARETDIGADGLTFIMEEVPPLSAAELLLEELRAIAQGLGAQEKHIIEQLALGFRTMEVACEVGVSRWTVNRVRESVRVLLERRLREIES